MAWVTKGVSFVLKSVVGRLTDGSARRVRYVQVGWRVDLLLGYHSAFSQSKLADCAVPTFQKQPHTLWDIGRRKQRTGMDINK